MSIRERLNRRVQFGDLPLWRKLVIIASLAVCLLLGWMAASIEVKIYTSAPTRPLSSTRQVVETRVMHGSVRYVTIQQEESLTFWESQAVSWVGLAFVVAFVVWATSPDRAARGGRLTGGA
jgi:hypothetical protein